VSAAGAGASSFLLQAVRAIANRDAISRVFVMIVFQKVRVDISFIAMK
jgi:hypothetical protein